jgi:hypothetical protein
MFRNLFKVFSKQQQNDDIDFSGHWKVTVFLQKPTFPLVFCVKNLAYIIKLTKSSQKIYQFLMLNLVWDAQ